MIYNLKLKLEGKLPITREELFSLISSWGRKDSFWTDDFKIENCKPNECYDLSNLDVSEITDLSYIFRDSPYNGDLSKWDVSNVQSMYATFAYSNFNNDSLKDWDVSNVITMEKLFSSSPFNSDLSKWNVSNVKYINNMFKTSKFNNDSLNSWNISNVIDMSYMFSWTNFNGDVSNWDISNVIDMEGLFFEGRFDGNISKWNFNKDIKCDGIFYGNEQFEKKYNNFYGIPNNSKRFLEWFEYNKNKMSSLNITKKEILELDDYLSNFDSKNNLVVFASPCS